MLARYNALANRRLYEACASLRDGELKRRRAAFFSSIHGALNHLMVGDRIWLARFAGEEAPSTNLDAILYEDFEELWEAGRGRPHRGLRHRPHRCGVLERNDPLGEQRR